MMVATQRTPGSEGRSTKPMREFVTSVVVSRGLCVYCVNDSSSFIRKSPRSSVASHRLSAWSYPMYKMYPGWLWLSSVCRLTGRVFSVDVSNWYRPPVVPSHSFPGEPRTSRMTSILCGGIDVLSPSIQRHCFQASRRSSYRARTAVLPTHMLPSRSWKWAYIGPRPAAVTSFWLDSQTRVSPVRASSFVRKRREPGSSDAIQREPDRSTLIPHGEVGTGTPNPARVASILTKSSDAGLNRLNP